MIANAPARLALVTALACGVIALATPRPGAAVSRAHPDVLPAHADILQLESYDSQGRRDPFRPSSVGGDACPGESGTLRAVRIEEVRLHGVLSSSERETALLFDRTARKTHFVQVGDRLCDGTVGGIDPERQQVVVRKERSDPGVGRPYREVVLALRPETD